MLVYFHIDEVARDAVVASALREEIKKVGGKLIYGNRTTTRRLRHFNVFDIVILPSMLHYMVAFPDPDQLPDNVVILPSETVGQGTGHLRRINAKYFGDDMEACAPWHKSVARYLLWGFDHLKPFQEYYPAYMDKCKVVGHPRLADICLSPTKAETDSKPVIGFVSRFSGLNPFDQRSFFSMVYGGMKVEGEPQPRFENSDNHDVEDLVYTETADLRVLLNVMRALDPEKYTLSIRVHPRENRKQWLDFIRKHGLNVVVSKWDDPFTLWLSEVDIIVSPPSTSFYEILFRGMRLICTRDVVPLRANHVLTESDDNNQILNYIYCPKSVDEITETINSGKVPARSEEIEGILEGQTGLSLVKNSIANVVIALRDLPGNTRLAVTRLRRLLPLVVVVVVLASYFQRWRDNFFRDGEQSSTFMFTLGRLRMINRLTKTIKRKTRSKAGQSPPLPVKTTSRLSLSSSGKRENLPS